MAFSNPWLDTRKNMLYGMLKVYRMSLCHRAGSKASEGRIMKFQVDQDLHIHSQLSICSGDPEQNTERILAYAKAYGLKHI